MASIEDDDVTVIFLICDETSTGETAFSNAIFLEISGCPEIVRIEELEDTVELQFTAVAHYRIVVD